MFYVYDNPAGLNIYNLKIDDAMRGGDMQAQTCLQIVLPIQVCIYVIFKMRAGVLYSRRSREFWMLI